MAEAPASFDTIFCGAIEIGSPQQRADFIADACGTNVELRARVEKMVAAHFRASGFLEFPAVGPAVATIDQTTETPGTVIGQYKLLQQIGEGGMGVVWMAEQTQPVQRKVALKVIKPGMDSRQVIARFEAERQALAMMDHVNIARVFDGGATEADRPYFVMELVHGIPITKYCDDNHLTPRERLELFVPVCQAIQHAHQKGIIHRDIKPSNVMVTLYDGKPVPKVIDFGVAKATEQKLTERTLFTQYGTMVGTLEYMSPEQAEMSALGVDTRSDIYSLGVLLYELLTGSTPLTHKRMKEAAYAEILRMIKEEEPPRPSTRLSDSGEALASISANRHTEPAKLSKLMRGELDWIVMKCLEKDRNRRYETANGFAADVQRYLADEPVLACPPSVGYRLRKFVRRNKGGLGVAALVLFFLVLLGSGVGWTLRDRSARAAERMNNLEQAVERAELLHREGKRGETLAALERVQLLAREAQPALPLAERIDTLQQLLDAEGRDEVFVARFEAIRRDVQTEVDIEKSYFHGEKAHPNLREALEHYGLALGVTPPAVAVSHIQKRPAAIRMVVVAALDECLRTAPRGDSGAREWLVDVLQKADSDPWRNKVRRAWKQPATLEAFTKDIDVRQQPPSFLLLVAHSLPIESPSRLDLARRVQFAYPGDFWANHELGWVLAGAGKDAEAVRYFTAALSLRPDNPGVLLNRAHALRRVRELEAAITDLQRAIALAPRYAVAHDNLGRALSRQGKLDDAIAAYRKAIELAPGLALAYVGLGLALSAQEKWDDAMASFHKAIELDPKCFTARGGLGELLNTQKKWAAATASFRQALEIKPADAAAHCGLNPAELARCYAGAQNGLGFALYHQGNVDEAIAAYKKATELDPKHAGTHYRLGSALHDQGKLDQAIGAYRKAIELEPEYAAAHYDLGCILGQSLRDHENAAACFRKVIELKPNSIAAYSNLGSALIEQNKLDEAIATYRKAIELDEQDARLHHNLGVALAKKGWGLINSSDPKVRDPKRAIEAVKEAVEITPRSEGAWLSLGWIHYRIGNWAASIEALEKSCKLQKGGTGNAGQWIVLALAHARIAAQEDVPEKERAHHLAEAHRRYEQADKNIDRWWRVRPSDLSGQAIWDFRAEARELMGAKENKK